jgi:cytochrome b involved in lipid metabolism
MNMSKKIFFGFLILTLVLILISGCTQKQNTQPTDKPSTTQQQATPNEQATGTATTQKYTMEEVAKHSTKEDCWLLISGKVYDVTKNIGVHPGGEAILQGCGKDATTLFETRPMGSGTPHSEKAREYLAKTYIGNLQQ